MQKTDTLYTAYVEVLKEELLPAMGCTEPIAIAYAAAAARRILNELPCEVCVTASGNIIKNVKSVFVPNTGGLRGIPAAAAAGSFYWRLSQRRPKQSRRRLRLIWSTRRLP